MFSYTPSPSAADASTPYVVDDHIWPGDPASLGFYGPAKAPLEVFVSFHAAQDIGGTISYFSSILLIM